MTTRRDTEVTDANWNLVFNQIRGLFRYAPFTQEEFALIAPNVAQTLSPGKPREALPIFWDVLDAMEHDKKHKALLALLGFSHHEGNVLDRRTSFNNDVNPRTVSRWADAALARVTTYIMDNFELKFAVVAVFIAKQGEGWEFSVRFTNTSAMEAPELVLNGEESRPELPGKNLASSVTLRTEGEYFDLTVTWRGSVRPDIHVMCMTPHSYGVKQEQETVRVQSREAIKREIMSRGVS